MLTAIAQDERERLLTRCASGRREKVLIRKSFDGNYYPLGLVKKQDSEILIAAHPSKIANTDKNYELVQYYLVEKNKKLSCFVCNDSVESNLITEEITKQMLQIVKRDFQLNQHPSTKCIALLVERETELLRKINIGIKELQIRLEEIKGLQISLIIKKRMICINTSEIEKLYENKLMAEVKLEFLTKPMKNDFKLFVVEKITDTLTRTPFIILYNFKNREVVLVPHNSVFQGEEKI